MPAQPTPPTPADAPRRNEPPPQSSPLLYVVIALAALVTLAFVLLLRFFLLLQWNIVLAILSAGGLALLLFIIPGAVILLNDIVTTQSRRGRQCLHCGYPFADLPDDAPCPECGTDRWSDYNVPEALDDDAIQQLLINRDRTLAKLLDRLPGRSITRVAYAHHEFRLLRHATPDLHITDCGVEFALDDGSFIHARLSAPPCYFLGLAQGPLDAPKRDVTSHASWRPYLNVPLAPVAVQRLPLPLNLLQVSTPIVEVPIDAFLAFQDGNMLILAARQFNPDSPQTADPGSDEMLVIFGTERATLLGIQHPG